MSRFHLLFETTQILIIYRRYLLSEVANALRYFGEGHARGKEVITVEHNNNS